MDLLEHEEKAPMRREDAAAKLTELADQLARHNQVTFMREGIRYTIDVPDEVKFSLEIEIGDKGEIEIELTW